MIDRNWPENFPTSCEVPSPCRRSEAQIYSSIRDTLIKAHCAGKRGHLCCGKITIDREHVTFNCPLCGDARQLISSHPGARNG